MKIFSISDVHASKNNIENYNILLTFLKRSLKEPKLDYLVMLGDIFNCMAGSYREYLLEYPEFFSLLKEISKKSKIIFVEGNHDFNLKDLFYSFLGDEKIIYCEKYFIINDTNKQMSILLNHGDMLDQADLSYLLLRKLFRSNFFKLFSIEFLNINSINAIEQFLNYFLAKNKKSSLNNELCNIIKNKYEKLLHQCYQQNSFDICIFGHNHCLNKGENNYFSYINNGYPSRDGMFCIYDNGKIFFNAIF